MSNMKGSVTLAMKINHSLITAYIIRGCYFTYICINHAYITPGMDQTFLYFLWAAMEIMESY